MQTYHLFYYLSEKKYFMNKRSKIYGPHNIDVCSLLFASLLGESYGEKRSGGTRFILQQEESNVTYLMWFHKFLASRGYCCPKKPKMQTRIGMNGKTRFFYRIRTYSFASLNWMYDAFYPNHKIKVVPKDLSWMLLTPLALAVWVMDDGAPVSAGLKIATNSFKEEEVWFLCAVLNHKFHLQARPFREKNQLVVYIPKVGVPRLSRFISPFMVPSMHLKLKS